MLTWFRVSLIGLALALPAAFSAAAWERRDEARVFFFGNSLIHQLTDSDATTVPHRLALLAQRRGEDFAADGRWGFPRDFAVDLPPKTEREFKEVKRVGLLWSTIRTGLYDTFILNTENYVQGNPPDHLYLGESIEQQSPLDATLMVLDWIDANSDGDNRFLIYEGWPGFDLDVKVFPPDRSDVPGLTDYAVGPYRDWFIALVKELRAARPGRQIDLIPIGRVMAGAISAPELVSLPPEAFFSDLSPHGPPATYLLAAMITYAALYGERSPAGFAVSGDIAPDFANNYEALADLVWREMQQADS